ncbi:hypothetical protein Tco_0944890 [Tanacetum coccineum]
MKVLSKRKPRSVPDNRRDLVLVKGVYSKLNKDLVKPYDYIKQNSLYEIFKPASQEYHDQLAHANEVRKKMWRKSFVKSKPNIFKNINFLPTSKSISKSRQAYNVLTNNINHFRELVDQAWQKHSHDYFRAPIAHDMEILIKTCLMPLTIKTQNDSFKFVHELKQEMHVDLKNISISELKKLLEKCKGKSVEIKFDKPYVVRQPNAQRIPKSSVLGKPTPFSDSLERKTRQAVRNINVIKPCMYRIDTRTTQTRASQFPQTSRNTNPRVSTSTGVIHKTNVNRPQLRSTQMKDKVVPNNSQVKFKNTEVEDHHMISSISNKTKSVTVCKDSLKSRTLNVNAVCTTCGKCVFNSNHDACVSKFLNDVNARTKKPKVVPISTRQPKSQANKYVATSPKKTVASESTIQKTKSYYRMLYEKTSTVHFDNDQFAPILGYGDLVQGNITINRVYYIKGLNHNLFSVGQIYDADLEVAFWKSTCFVRDLQEYDLHTKNHGSDLYTISL